MKKEGRVSGGGREVDIGTIRVKWFSAMEIRDCELDT